MADYTPFTTHNNDDKNGVKMSDEEQIIATLEDYAKAYCAKDIDALMAVFDADDRISVIGTGQDELCVGRQAVKQLFLRNFNDATATQFQWDWSTVAISGNHALIGLTLIIKLTAEGELTSLPIRWTVALKKTDRWVWIHRHASTASNSQTKGKAYPSSIKMIGS
ncbi:nuclear transport factor 2 family protein [Shewanella pealeana]|nr:nuclear transport factor 2 family protein [Shewanella pealeana]